MNERSVTSSEISVLRKDALREARPPAANSILAGHAVVTEADSGTCKETVEEHPAEGLGPLQTTGVSSIVEVWLTVRPYLPLALHDVFYDPRSRKSK